jgi:uncharacterized protein (UPF0335 family)
MKTRIAILIFAFAAFTSFSVAQQSDYEIKERFKSVYETLKRDIDSARTKEQTAQIPNRIKGLETEFAEHATLISGAFYPKTFDTMLGDLREQFTVAQERNTTIQNQGERITILEGQLAGLSAEIEKLNVERKELMAQLKSANISLAQQRSLVKALNVNLAAKDKLVNAMVDSIFLPFGKNMDALSEVQKDALGKKLEKASIISRIADIANDNVRFLEATKLEAKDYGTLVSQYDQFKNRWTGLRDKVSAAIVASTAATAKQSKKGQPTPEANPADQVDAALNNWHSKLDASFWASLTEEFKSRNVLVQPFNDAKSFSASIRSYVESAQRSGEDTKAFVDEIWIQRIDKDWRPALESETMLGKLEYASLDKTVSQLHKEKFNWSILWWVLNVLAAAGVVWWFLTRKPKAAQQVATATKPNV